MWSFFCGCLFLVWCVCRFPEISHGRSQIDHRHSAPDIPQVKRIRVLGVSVKRWGARAPVHYSRSIIYHEEDYAFSAADNPLACRSIIAALMERSRVFALGLVGAQILIFSERSSRARSDIHCSAFCFPVARLCTLRNMVYTVMCSVRNVWMGRNPPGS